MNYKVREADEKDLTGIVSIYNEAVRAGFQTADIEEVTIDDRQEWFEMHKNSKFVILVLESKGKLIGWLSLSPYRKGREALNKNAEISYYLSKDFQGKALGSFLMEFGIKEAKSRGFMNLIAILLSANIKSIGLLKKFGFEEWGRMPQVARIKEGLYDHLYFGLKIK